MYLLLHFRLENERLTHIFPIIAAPASRNS
jgi:hypothetical protein